MNTCSHCARCFAADQDGGLWTRTGICPSCGRFVWQARVESAGETLARTSEEMARFRLWLTFWYLGFAVEMHERWLARPWLTRPACACHPDAFVTQVT